MKHSPFAVTVLLIALLPVAPALARNAPPEPFAPNGLVVLFSDYGADSLDAGLLEAAVRRKAPEVRVTTLSHTVPAFDVAAGAQLLAEACTAYPEGTVFIADVGGDPTAPLVVLRTEAEQVFVAPDNGLLMLVAAKHPIVELYACTNEDLWRFSRAPNDTAHGPAVRGAVAGALASGTALDAAGMSYPGWRQLPLEPARMEGGKTVGRVLYVNAHGHVVTNLRGSHLDDMGLKPGRGVEVHLLDQVTGLDYVEGPGSVPPGDRYAYVNHLNLVAFGANGYAFAKLYGITGGEPVTLAPIRDPEE